MIGTKLGHYEIARHIGSCGMGDVCQATDTNLGRSVAIKLLPGALTHDADRLARFRREARVLASLNHPHICVLHEMATHDGIDLLLTRSCTLSLTANRDP